MSNLCPPLGAATAQGSRADFFSDTGSFDQIKLIRREIKPEAMRPDFGMFERPHPTAALFIFPANETPRFGEKQLLMNLMRVARRVRIPLETPRDK